MRTFVAAVLLAAAPVLAAPVLEDVRVLPGPRPAVTLRLSAPAVFHARALQADGVAPHRLYLDLAGTALGASAPRVRDGAGALIRVRTGQFDPETTRVVLDLSGEMPFDVTIEGSTVTVTLSPPPVTAKEENEAPGSAPAGRAATNAASPESPPIARAESNPVAPEPTPPAKAESTAVAPEPPPVAKAETKATTPEKPPASHAENKDPAPGGPAPGTPPAEKAGSAATTSAPALAPQPETKALPPSLPSMADSKAAAPEPPVTQHGSFGAPPAGPLIDPLVGPPAPVAGPPRPLTPQDVIVMTAPRSPAPDETAPTTTVPPPAKVAAVAPPPSRARGSAAIAAPAPGAAAPAKPAPQKAPRITPAPTPTPLVVLDAGHGGRDPGAEGVGGVIEKDVVLELTRVLAKRMTERLHVNVFLTRSDDSYVTIDRRLAVPSDAILFISLHANSCPDPSARGLEIFYGGGAVRPADTTGASPRAALLGRYLDEALNARVGGVRGSARLGSFSILVRNPLPSALIEIGYLTHPEEAALSQDAVYRELMADALVDGLEAFLRAAAPPL